MLLRPRRAGSSGFTLIELLIVLAIIALLAMLLWFSITKYFQESRDSVRKTHLEKYRVALEEYFADNNRYPPEDLMDDCFSADLKPYLPQIYCDPVTNEPYRYSTNSTGSRYDLYTNLDSEEDLDIQERGCDGGCGPDDNGDGTGDYDYGFTNSQVGVGDSVTNEVPTVCTVSGKPFCPKGQCSTCCPGAAYRCNSTGSACYPDTRCSY